MIETDKNESLPNTVHSDLSLCTIILISHFKFKEIMDNCNEFYHDNENYVMTFVVYVKL